MKIQIICIGKLKEKWEREACAEYVKRLGRFCALEICELSDQPEPDKPSEALNRRVMEKEGREILARIRPNDRVVALCIKGNSYDSEQFAAKLAGWSMDGRRLVLVIGGSCGAVGRGDRPRRREAVLFKNDVSASAYARDIARAALSRLQNRRKRALSQIKSA